MTARTGRGTAMQAHKIYWRIRPANAPTPRVSRDLDFRIVEVRKLLRTSLSIQAIADELGVGRTTLIGFIKRRRLCNLKDRREFHSLQASLAKEEQKEASR